MPAASPSPRRPLRWLALFVALIALVAPVAPVTGQEFEPAAVELRLVQQPVWHRPGDPLDIRLRVVNRGVTPVNGFLLSLTAHPVTRTRSALQESFRGNAGAVLSATSQTFAEVLEASEGITIDLDDEFETPSSLVAAAEAGAYPLTISVSDEDGAILFDTLTTPLILYPKQSERLIPLNLSMVLPLNDLPSRGPDGVYRDPLERETIPLEEAVSEQGWFTGLAAALEAHAGELPDLERTVTTRIPRRNGRRPRIRTRTVSVPQRGLHLGLAPTPRLVEELEGMADGYRRLEGSTATSVAEDAPAAAGARQVLTTLSATLGEEGVQTLLVPYSFPDIPSLARHAPERIETELDEGAEVLSNVLGEEPSRAWLFAPAGRLGSQSLEELRFTDDEVAQHTLFQPDSFEVPVTVDPPGCPKSFASFTCPVAVRTSAGPTVGLVGDQGLQDRFVDLVQRNGRRLALQNFFAETATIRQELPSIAGRVVQVTVPSLWHPPPQLLDQLLGGLRNAPWLRTVTPDEAVDLGRPRRRSDEFVEQFAALPADPGEALYEEIDETTSAIEAFRRMGPPETMVERLRRNTLVAESRIWWTVPGLADIGVDYLEESERRIRAEIEKVTVAGPDEINLTSQEGEIPLVVVNETGFPTSVRISLRSPERDLVLDPQEFATQRIDAGGSFQFTVEAVARSSGIFQMEVLVDTPRGELDIASKSITVRSTAFNLVAVGITIGALVFLLAFYAMRLLRRRREAES